MKKNHLSLYQIMMLAALSMSVQCVSANNLDNLRPIGGMGKGERVLGGGKEAVLFEHKGKGALYQVAIAAKGTKSTYLEACMRAYLGENKKPLMLSSGLEDYFLGTYYFDTGKFHADIAGLTHFDSKNKSFSAYRFHDEDPVFFQDGLRLTCRCGETEHGRANETKGYLNPTKTEYTTYTWVYQW